MKRGLKKIIVLLLCFTMLGTTSVVVSADGIDDVGKVVDGSELTLENSAEKVINTLVRGNILNQGTVRITNNENGTVNVFGAV